MGAFVLVRKALDFGKLAGNAFSHPEQFQMKYQRESEEERKGDEEWEVNIRLL